MRTRASRNAGLFYGAASGKGLGVISSRGIKTWHAEDADMAITTFTMKDGREQHPTYFREPSNSNWKLVFGGASVKTVAIPAGAKRAIFGFTTDIVVALDEAAVYPVADSTALDGGELNPAALWVEGGTELSVAAGAAGIVCVTFYG